MSCAGTEILNLCLERSLIFEVVFRAKGREE